MAESAARPSNMEDQNPHIRDTYSPLDTLMIQAFRRYGEFSAETIEGDAAMMVIEFGNEIVDDIHMHPYASAADKLIPYYESVTDSREIHDTIVRAGLLARFAMQQMSEQTNLYMGDYYKKMNGLMWRRLNDNTAIRLRQVDDGTNSDYLVTNKTKVVNGLPDG